MLDIRFIREHSDEVRESVRRRGLKVDIDGLLELDKKRVSLQQQSDELRSKLKTSGRPSEDELKKLQSTKAEFEKVDGEHSEVSEKYKGLLWQVPNLIADGTPDGGEEANRPEKTSGGLPKFDFEPLDHLALNKKLDFVDFEAGSKVAGSKFYFLKDKAVRLEWAVNTLAMKLLREEGFAMMAVPHLVTEHMLDGTGFAPRGEEDQIYKIEGEDLHLIATAEISLTGMLAGDIIDIDKPHKYAGFSPCYRKEAGAYGKFSKGLYRVHQFDKLEMYIFCKPEESEQMLASILAIEEKLCQALEIPYRLVRIAAGDLSAPAYKKYDIEYWSPTDKDYKELTSCSNCTDYQARRLNIRYRTEDGNLAFPHTLNGTAVTSSRTLIALLENHQTKDGEVAIPKALQEYYGADKL